MMKISERFRGFLPIVIGVETGGFDGERDALREIGAVLVQYDFNDKLVPARTLHYHVRPFAGAQIAPESLKLTGIDPFHPLRPALEEKDCAERFFGEVLTALQESGCNKAILVGHNASFDLGFLRTLARRTGWEERFPFHSFSTFDTVSLGGLIYGQTVLSRIATAAGFKYNSHKAHGAKYDAELTAAIFCQIVNVWGNPIGELK